MRRGSHLTIYGNAYYFERVVPKQYAKLDTRRRIKKSLGRMAVTTEAEAREKAALLDRELEAFWRALERAPESEAELYSEAKPIAKELGFQYLSADEIANETDFEERRSRLRKAMSVTKRGSQLPIAFAAALFGGPKEPPRSVSNLLEWYFDSELDKASGKAPAALKAWRQRKRTAFSFFIEIVGDIDVSNLERADFLKWRNALFKRSELYGLKLSSLNRSMNEVLGVFTAASRGLQILLPDYSGLRFSTEQEMPDTPEPYDVSYLQDRFLANGALDNFNNEGRRVLFAMLETGMRPSEIVNILPENIRLDAAVPHLRVVPTKDARLKNRSSRREIPLVGVALMAMQAQPEGFPRYRYKPDVFSAAANKFLKESDLKPTPRHSVYSLRHSFEARSRLQNIPEGVWTEIFGHAYARQKYGAPTLQEKRDYLAAMALKPPEYV